MKTNKWKPIDSAPEDGCFLVYIPTDNYMTMQVAKIKGAMKVIGGNFWFDVDPPTHWMPLPPPPTIDN